MLQSIIKTHDKLVNLMNVSNINIVRNNNKNQYRIVFNMNYSIEMVTTKRTKIISDYVYWDFKSIPELEDALQDIESNEYFENNFIDKLTDEGYINSNEISSIKFVHNRVIFNLSHSVTFMDKGAEKLTSEFVYINCDSALEYKEYVKYLQETL